MASNKLKINADENEDKFIPVFEDEKPKAAEEKKEEPKAKKTSKLRKLAKFKRN